jgi:calcium-dependent secretion activator
MKNLPEMDGLNKETVMNSWVVKFETIVRGDDDQRKGLRQAQNAATASELIQSKDQLYDIFQNILGVKKFEHQLLFNALQVSSLCFYIF